MSNSKMLLFNRIQQITKNQGVTQQDSTNDYYNLDTFHHTIVEWMSCELDTDNVSETISSLENEFNQLPVIEKELAKMQSDVSSLDAIRKELNSLREQITLTVAAENNCVKIVSPAVFPANPVSPNRLLVLAISILLGGAAGVLLCLFLSMKDDSLYSLEEIKKIIGPNISVLGWIPLVKIQRQDQTKDSQVLILNGSYSFLAERYQQITLSILYGRNKNNKVFTITSSGINECKSSVTGNIGICLAKQGHKVLIIDMDLKFPSIEKMFGVPLQKEGIAELAQKGEDIHKAIVTPVEKIPNLQLAILGKGKSASSLNQDLIERNFLSELKKTYEYILIDAPPMEYMSEVLGLFKLTDATILCVRLNICTKNNLSNLLAQLKDYHITVGGVVATACTFSNIGSYTSHYGQYSYQNPYHKYSMEGNKFIKSERKAKSVFKKDIKRRKKYMQRHSHVTN
ncbi:MAG: GNVR domain-containing protein [Sphaerochaetaceae bacterium]